MSARGFRTCNLISRPSLAAAIVLLASALDLRAQAAADAAVLVSATVEKIPQPKITLTWPSRPTAPYTVNRKALSDTTWGATLASLPATATSYVDTNVTVGTRYEYRVASGLGTGYIVSGIEIPLVENRGKVILLVDDSQAAGLGSELNQLQLNLVGDGWTPIRYDVSRTDTPSRVKNLIKREYARDPANVKAVFLFGHVPVPYSGAMAPDGHGDHYGAWPADPFYADVDGPWTDTVNYDSTVAGRQHNVAGDGKYDGNDITGDVELWVGRVDLANMPAFAPKTELDLLRQYLNKDHNFRHRIITALPRGLIDDNFGLFGGEAFAASGWRNFSTFFGASNVFALDWFTTLNTQSYLWAYGCGGGSYTSAGGVGSTSNFAATDTRVVFTMLFGSYHGDWDTTNNFLRAPLATTTYGLTNAWSGRPHWQFHHMATGDPIGRSAQVTQNNNGLYVGGIGNAVIHAGLMGDPTLRMHPVAPLANLTASPSGSNVALSWLASTDTIVGYHVYRSPSPSGPFIRLTSVPITTTSFTDTGAGSLAAGIYTYMVRAIKLEVSKSGSYFNASQGLFQQIAAGTGAQTSDRAVRVFVDPATVAAGSDFDYTVEVTNNGPADSTGVQWTHQFPAGVTYVSVQPSAGCSTAGSTLQCNVGNLARGARLLFKITANGVAAGTHTATSQVTGSQADPSASNSSATSSIVVVARGDTTTLLSTSGNPVNVGASITLTATVLSAVGGVPTGTVTFKNGATTLGTGALSAAGKATFTTSGLPVGVHPISADYSGDSRFNPSTATMTQTVRATTTTALVSSLNPSIVGQVVTFTATVTANSGTASGSVSFRNGGTVMGTGILDATGRTSFTTSTLAAGTLSITALFNGGGAYAPSTSPPVSQVVNAATGAATTTALVSSLNPSVVGQNVTFTATVSSAAAGTPTGTVVFKRGATTLGNAALNGSSQAAFSTNSLTAGNNAVTATYNGDGNFAPSTSPNVVQVVKAVTTATLTSDPNPSTPGQSVTFTAVITTVGGAPSGPTGLVTFSEGSTALGTRGITGAGVSTFVTTTLSAGTHTIVAAYSGDTYRMPSTSTGLSHVVAASTCNPAYGDLNQDGLVNAVDLVILSNFMAGNLQQGPAPFTADSSFADLNRSGLIDAVDLVLLQNYMAGNITCLPF